jgi:hypothetical protein
MKFHGKNFMKKKIRQMLTVNAMEFSMEFHRIFHGTEVDGISWNSMEFREFMEFDEIRFRQGMNLHEVFKSFPVSTT